LSRWASRRDDASLRSWLFTILYRQFLDGKRSAKRYAWLLGRIRDDEDAHWPSAEREFAARATLEAFGRSPTSSAACCCSSRSKASRIGKSPICSRCRSAP
jgi:DNA-directed RNA polymerase specialized sigma24 family protein